MILEPMQKSRMGPWKDCYPSTAPPSGAKQSSAFTVYEVCVSHPWKLAAQVPDGTYKSLLLFLKLS